MLKHLLDVCSMELHIKLAIPETLARHSDNRDWNA